MVVRIELGYVVAPEGTAGVSIGGGKPKRAKIK